jgi:hypothetical protein
LPKCARPVGRMPEKTRPFFAINSSHTFFWAILRVVLPPNR